MHTQNGNAGAQAQRWSRVHSLSSPTTRGGQGTRPARCLHNKEQTNFDDITSAPPTGIPKLRMKSEAQCSARLSLSGLEVTRWEAIESHDRISFKQRSESLLGISSGFVTHRPRGPNPIGLGVACWKMEGLECWNWKVRRV